MDNCFLQDESMIDEGSDELHLIRAQIWDHLYQEIMPFWANHGIDHEFGGYLTNLDAQGNLIKADMDKYIVTQTRMIWGMSVFSELLPDVHEYQEYARKGVDFFIHNFWDQDRGGWAWRVNRDGSMVDNGKVVYGQSFAIYALAQYTLSTKDPRGLSLFFCRCQ
jgi:mannobiose 2-epimerase